MKIGIVSDTHNNLKNVTRIVELFNEAGVERVIHTGDITQAKTIEVFKHLNMPMFGVYGNNDVDERDSLEPAIAEFGFHFVEPPLVLDWASRSIIVVHDPLEFEGVRNDSHEIALHGHTHRQTIVQESGRLTFNPGECAGHMKGYNAIGVLDLVTMTPEILNF
ncbi:MAG: YfcE family phosphodiesterase [Pseudomonadota bacterium]